MCLSCGNNNVLFCCIVVHEVGVVFRYKGKGKDSLISSLKTYHATLHLTPWSLDTGPVHSWASSAPQRAYSPAAVSAH